MRRKTRRMLREAGSTRNIAIGAGLAVGIAAGIFAMRRWQRGTEEILNGPGELNRLDADESLAPNDADLSEHLV